jgi:hypothetical protein
VQVLIRSGRDDEEDAIAANSCCYYYREGQGLKNAGIEEAQ